MPNSASMRALLLRRPKGALPPFSPAFLLCDAAGSSNLFLSGARVSPIAEPPQPTSFFTTFLHLPTFLPGATVLSPAGILNANRKKFVWQQGVRFCQSATYSEEEEDDNLEDENGHEEYTKCSSLEANMDEWKKKLNVFIKNTQKQELVSMDRKDRRDYQHLSVLAGKLGLYSQMYGRVVAFSKVPLPHYRADLDEKRPARKVSISPSVHRAVNALLQKHRDQKQPSVIENARGHILDDQLYGNSLSSIPVQSPDRIRVSESVLQIKNKTLQDKQQAWRDSPEGQKMMALRASLPAFKQRDELLSALAKNQVLVVSGETGCGKTTQLPQYILESEIEAGKGASCSIICTQPRRISALSVAERVAAERGERLGDSVGYKVRLEGTRGRDTHLLFCTTGILLRRLLVDPSLTGVSHVLVDEIHERGMNEDFLLIVLKDLLPRRPDLRLVLMSATLNAKLFSNYFNSAPTCHIPGFTHPVRAHFLEDVLELTGHRLTEYNQIDNYGQDKSWKMQKQLQNRKRKNTVNGLVEDAIVDADFRQYKFLTQASLSKWSPEGLGFNLIAALLCHIVQRERPGAVLVFMTGWEDIKGLKDQLSCHPLLGDKSKVWVLPCHGGMATAEQKLIFEHAPPNVRKIVLATNMAETSITINDVVFVVDCGKAKETSYDALNNTPCLLPTWISKASARQRRGRAGRVQPGEAYHLYPKVVYDAFAEYQLPELHRTPLHALCLQIKSLRLGSIEGFLAKAMQPPDGLSVQNSIQLLMTIGALDDKEDLTRLGYHLSMLPVQPMIGKMLVMGSIFGCLEPVLTIAAGLSLRDPFVTPFEKKELAEKKRFAFGVNDCSDHMAYVRAYDGWQNAKMMGTGMEYCWDNFLSAQTLEAMYSLRRQFKELIRQSGFIEMEGQDCNDYGNNQGLLGGVICSGLFPGVAAVLPKKNVTHFKTVEDGEVLLYQNSVLSKMGKLSYPWVVFDEKVKTGTVFIRDSTGISDTMLLLFGGKVKPGVQPGHLLMQDGWLEFFMLPELAKTILQLKTELNALLSRKMENPKLDIFKESNFLLDAVLTLLNGDQNEGTFTFVSHRKALEKAATGKSEDGVKGALHNCLQQEGQLPTYEVKGPKGNLFQARVKVRGHYFIGKPATSKKQAERNAAAEALEWLKNNFSSFNAES